MELELPTRSTSNWAGVVGNSGLGVVVEGVARSGTGPRVKREDKL